jgi:phenylacetate-CoA ligase
MQNAMVSAYGYQWMKRRMGGSFNELYKAAKERENFTAQQWCDFENSALQKILLHAFETVPYYKKSFAQAGLNIDGIKKITVDSLNQIPILTKEQLRQVGTTTLLSDKKENNGEFFASSGSTGTPTKILFSHPMHQRWYAIFEARVRNWAGVDSFTPRGMIGGRRVLPSSKNVAPFYRYNYFEKQVYFSAYHISEKNAENYLQGIKKYGVQYMTGYAMSNFFLARFFKELNLEVPQLKAVITSSEKLTDEMRVVFKDVYQCKTFDGWSGVEACALITECENGSLHISPDAGFIEVLNENMQPASFGKRGKVYCTGFLNLDQTLIRYDSGDEIILSEKKCSCGRNMPLVQEILGRVEDVVIGKDGREMVRFHGIFNGLISVKNAQLIQESFDEMKIKIVPDVKFNMEDEKTIRNRIESQLGNINIFIEEVNEIPLNNNGKYQAVISKVKRK